MDIAWISAHSEQLCQLIINVYVINLVKTVHMILFNKFQSVIFVYNLINLKQDLNVSLIHFAVSMSILFQSLKNVFLKKNSKNKFKIKKIFI